MDLGDAVEGAAAKLRELVGQALATEDPALEKAGVDLGHAPAAAVEVDHELLEAGAVQGRGDDAVKLPEACRRVRPPLHDRLAALAHPLGTHGREGDGGE